MGISRRGLLVGTALGLLSGCGRAPASPATVKVAMGYIPNVQFTPMYAAIDAGYFSDERLTVELDYGWETDILALLGANQLQYAIASGDQVILARARGLPVVYVYDWYNRFPVSVASLADRGITKPEDLAGKVVGTPATFGSSYIGWRALLSAVGMAESQVQLQTIGYTQVAALSSGQVDAALCFYMNEPVQLREAGFEVNQILISDYMPLPAAGIVTNETTIKQQPDVLERLVRAFSKGLKQTLDEPDAAFAAAEKAVPEIAGSRDVQRAVLEACLDLWRADELGRSDEQAWGEAADFMLADKLIDQAVDPATAYTNRFVPTAG